MQISALTAQEILDSNSHPTLEVTVTLADGTVALSGVPSGASTGEAEAIELRDGDKLRYGGKGVIQAVEIVNTVLADLVRGHDAYDQHSIDSLMIEADGTANKSKLGGNCMTGVSMAVCRAAARSQKQPLYRYIQSLSQTDQPRLPTPLILIMEGGRHGDWATDVQEFMIVPTQAQFANFHNMLRSGSEIFHTLMQLNHQKGFDTGVGYEGAFAPQQLQGNQEAIELIIQACQQAGYNPGEKMMLALDVAASEFFDQGHYVLKSEQNRTLTPQEWHQQISDWVARYPIMSLEDIFEQHGWDDWSKFNQQFGQKLMIVGDDLIVTNTNLIQTAIDKKAINASLIKVNQVGTVTETLRAILLSKQNNLKTIISHRGGETNDDFIADLAVGTAADYCKFGGPDRGERLAKYNRLLRIEHELNLS